MLLTIFIISLIVFISLCAAEKIQCIIQRKRMLDVLDIKRERILSETDLNVAKTWQMLRWPGHGKTFREDDYEKLKELGLLDYLKIGF